MENKDRPTHPVIEPVTDKYGSQYFNVEFGLTKREHFAGLAMQGMMANPEFKEWDSIRIVKESIVTADELLKQLVQ